MILGGQRPARQLLRQRGAPDAVGCERAALIGEAEVVFQQGPLMSPLYQRDDLVCGNRISGPALVIQMDATTVVPPGWGGAVDPFGNLLLEPE